MKRKLFLILLVAMISMMFVACASKADAPADPAKDEAVALMDEVNSLKADAEAAGAPESFGKWGRAMSIYDLGVTYFDKEMYTESLQPLGQAKTYFTSAAGK